MLMRTAAVTAVVTLPLVAFCCFTADVPFLEMSEVAAQTNRRVKNKFVPMRCTMKMWGFKFS
jgi:hypothetical protein